MTNKNVRYSATALMVRLKISRPQFYNRWNRMVGAMRAGHDAPALLPSPVVNPQTGDRWWTEEAVAEWERDFGHDYARNYWKERADG